MRVVVAPDSFKGSLDAPEACAAIARGLAQAAPEVVAHSRPMADGGEGTLDAVLTAVGSSGRRHARTVRGAGGDPTNVEFGLLDDAQGTIAVIEIAQVVGITDAAAMRVDVGVRSTRGVGELMAALLDQGVRRFMIGLGGSSTNDGGSGLLAALGIALLDAAGRPLAGTPDGLASLARIDASRLDPRLTGVEIRIMSDVNNPLWGPRGASAVFGPQKGATPAQVAAFDAALARFASLIESAIGTRVAEQPGAGAAGGLGFALQVLGGAFDSGAEIVATLIGLDEALADADWAITGEGKSDAQTLLAKAPFVVAQHAAARGVPVTLLSGAVDQASLPLLGRHFAGCFGLANGPASLDDCIANAATLLEARAQQVARLFLAAHGRAARSMRVE